jgi:hypothetical protein
MPMPCHYYFIAAITFAADTLIRRQAYMLLRFSAREGALAPLLMPRFATYERRHAILPRAARAGVVARHSEWLGGARYEQQSVMALLAASAI